MLVRREALTAAGGFAAIRGALIDDCALAAKLKAVGPIWLGLTSRAFSIRPYDHFGDIRRMVARSAYAQLRYSPIALAGTVFSMLLVYVLPPFAALLAQGPAHGAGWAIWATMAVMFAPTLMFYGLSAALGRAAARRRPHLCRLHAGFRLAACARPGRDVEGQDPGCQVAMTALAEIQPSKGHTDENFPVASLIIAPRHRATILAFYRFARAADDVADHPRMDAQDKLRRLDDLGKTLLGAADSAADALPLRAVLAGEKTQSAACARSAHRVSSGCDQEPLRGLGRSDGLLPLFRGPGRTLRFGCPRREPKPLAGQRRALRGAASHQPPAGLRQRLPRSGSGLRPPGRARLRRPRHRSARRACCIACLASRSERFSAKKRGPVGAER